MKASQVLSIGTTLISFKTLRNVMGMFVMLVLFRFVFMPLRYVVVHNGYVPTLLHGKHIIKELAVDFYVLILMWLLLLLGGIIVCMLVLGWYKLMKRMFAS